MTPSACVWNRLLVNTLLLGIGSIASVGCQRTDPPAAKVAVDDFWDVMFVQGSRVGHTHTTIKPFDESGRELVKLLTESQLTIVRYGQKIEQAFELTSIETPAGELVSFTTRTAFGPTPMDTSGRVNQKSGKLEMSTTVGDREVKSSLPWPAGCRGFFGSEQSLRERPMQAGERRSFPAVVPIINQIATIEMVGRGKQPTELLDGKKHELLRIDTVTLLPDGNEIVMTMWTDAIGETLKTSSPAMQQETFRTTKALALSKTAPGKFDLGLDSMVRIEPPLKNPHGTKKVRYRLELDGGDPAKVFAPCPSQSVKSLSDHAAEVTVFAINPESLPDGTPKPAKPTDGDLKPNALVESDDPRIIELAQAASAGLSGDWELAKALEKYVHLNVKNKNFSQAFASAAEVAKSREGDCTEHAVFLAALLRARGIPARVAIGLVYVETSQAFGYHMWTEAWVNGHWIPLDATLGRGGIGGAHLKLLDTNLEGANAYSSFLPVAQVLGRLKIKVLDVE